MAPDAAHGNAPGPPRPSLWRRGRFVIVIGLVGAIFWATGCMERLFYYPVPEPTPVPRGFPGAEAIAFTSADGVRLHGWFLPALDEDGDVAARAPALLHVHGNAGNMNYHLGASAFLPAAGYGVLLFDYRGYGESDGAARRRTDLIADAEAALDVLLARPDVDPARVGLYAQSLGAGIGLNVMARRPELRTGVVISGFTSWREIAADAVGGGDAGPVARALAWLLIRDHDRPDEAAASIDRPLLILHGTEDTIVPVGHGRRLAETARNARYVELDGADHNGITEWPGFADAVLGFLDESMGGR